MPLPAEVAYFTGQRGRLTGCYASEADALNMALFGLTAREWREKHPGQQGNLRDKADVWQRVCLSNLENLHALFIRENLPQAERLKKLNRFDFMMWFGLIKMGNHMTSEQNDS